MHTGRKGRYTARISLLMKRSDLGRVRFEAVLRSVHRFVRLVHHDMILGLAWACMGGLTFWVCVCVRPSVAKHFG